MIISIDVESDDLYFELDLGFGQEQRLEQRTRRKRS